MSKVRFVNKYKTPFEMYTTTPVEVYVDEFTFAPIHRGTTRIVVLEEPLQGDVYDKAKKYPEYYDYLFTYQDELLQSNPKAVFFRCADTWVHGYVPDKKFSVSFVVGGKNDPRMAGYALRQNVWRKRDGITIPKEFYLSANYKWSSADYTNNLVLGESKTPLFDSMFHIAIENTSIKNYFSEKLLDCFHTRTVPLYWGCTNLEQYYNIYGVMCFSNVAGLVTLCNKLTPEMYESMMPAIEDNYQRAQKMINYWDQFKQQLIDFFNKLGILCQQV